MAKTTAKTTKTKSAPKAPAKKAKKTASKDLDTRDLATVGGGFVEYRPPSLGRPNTHIKKTPGRPFGVTKTFIMD